MRTLLLALAPVLSLSTNSVVGAVPIADRTVLPCNSTNKALVIQDSSDSKLYQCDGTNWKTGISPPQFCANGSLVYGIDSAGSIACAYGTDAGTQNVSQGDWNVTSRTNACTQSAQTYGGGDAGTMTVNGVPWIVVNPGESNPAIAINADGGGLTISPQAGDLWKATTGTRTAPYLMTSVCNLGVTSLGQQMRWRVWRHDQTTPINFDGTFTAIWAPAVSGVAATLVAQGTLFYNAGASSDFEANSSATGNVTNAGVNYDGGFEVNTIELQTIITSPLAFYGEHNNTAKGGLPAADSTFIPVYFASTIDFASFQNTIQSNQNFGFGSGGFGAPGNGIAPNVCFLFVAIGCSTNTGSDTGYVCNIGGWEMAVK